MKLTLRNSASASAQGFTLIEIMIALAILGLVLVMLASSFHAVAAGKTHAENRLAADQEARSMLYEMSSEVRGAVQTPLLASRSILVGQGRMENNTPLDSITFSTLDPGHRRSLEGFGAEDTLTYTTAASPAHRGWFMLLRSQSSSLLGIGTGGNANAPVVMADNLLSLHIRYFDGRTWAESWNSQSLPPGQGLPQAVAIDLSVAPPAGAPVVLSTIVTMPMAFQQW